MLASAGVLLAATTLLAAGCSPGPETSGSPEIVVFLVRHAERAEDGTNDPHISPGGATRSLLLAELLRDAGITRIHATDFHRTRETAAPLAEAAGLPVEPYDADDLEAFAEELRRSPGRHLVVGHSNTTPQLVSALGGDPGTEIETMEYDRLYVVTLSPMPVTTVLLRFGARFGG